ncbi:MAG: alpha/beta fold hydrolase [Sphingomonas sp.]|uniref:alpha/beta hydrolase n=1 Tax=Sphingomonas sp. TaxID=28214 RepID=UPI0025D1FEDC|nr:alpha/beta fold hydrolase [Sphingomonas sp.]MBX3564152.1 alpha/beta fold hydrolase [Sphingomonas sp.]
MALLALISSVSLPGSAHAQESRADPPLSIIRQGAFEAGGNMLGKGPDSTSCDHGHVEYQIPAGPRATALFLWHSSTAAVWQRRWDGGEGFQSIFLRRGFPIYIWDGPRVGRANYGCESYTYTPLPGRDAQSFVGWRLGPSFQTWFPGVQFPTTDAEAWNQAARARYDEFDTVANAQLEAEAAAAALKRVGNAVLVTNSAGGLRAMLTALRSPNVAAIVAYETPGFVFPEGEGPQIAPGRFGPVYVSAEEFRKLTRIPIQLVWGDNIDQSPFWKSAYALARQWVDIVNAHGGKAEILHLPERGLRGNTHIPFADMNNAAVADLLSEFLRRNHLDGRARAKGSR